MRPTIRAAFLLVALSSAALFAFGPIRLPNVASDDAPTEALAGFTMVTNGFTDQAEFDFNRGQFEEAATILANDEGGGGLGPTYNADSCVACHNNPTTGAGSQIAELRCGKMAFGFFVAPPGGTLVRQRAIDPAIQQRVPDEFDIRTRRMSTSLFGLGYVEFIADATILAVQAGQTTDMRGTVIVVPTTVGISTAGSQKLLRPLLDTNTGIIRRDDGGLVTDSRIGRFGWKCQQGSLLDFAADADLNEKGITSVIQPIEATALDGRSLSAFDRVADPEDAPVDGKPFGKDVTDYTRFMRALRVPPRDWATQNTPDVLVGEQAFAACQCSVCHVSTWQTAPPGATIKGILGTVPPALGNRLIHPYSDLMLHDAGTGDGIVQAGGLSTRNMVRTPLLWGLRCRNELMHDGLSYTFRDAIKRHGGQAAGSRSKFDAMTLADQERLLAFLRSL